MGFFIDKQDRRKSPVALAAFGAAAVYLAVYGVLYAVLAGPLYRAVRFESGLATTAVHSLIIAAVGTAVCCLFFLLRDKRVAPYGFAGLAVALVMFYAAAMLQEGLARQNVLYLITAYGLAPVLVGNAVAWPVYLCIKRAHPDMNRRKTVAQELRDAVEREQTKRPEKKAADAPAPKDKKKDIPPEEALFGPEAGVSPRASRSAQEEAMLLYEDEDKE